MGNEWIKVKLKDICFNINVTVKTPEEAGINRFVGLEHLKPEEIEIASWGLTSEGTKFNKRFLPGQVLFGKRRSYQKKAAIARFQGVCSGDILVFEANTEILLPELLPYIVQNDKFFDYAVGTSSGSLSPRTSWKHLSEYSLRIPKEKVTQQKILSKLLSFEAALSLKKELIQKTLVYKSKLSRYLLYNGINHNEFKPTELGEIPVEWDVYPLGEIGVFLKGKGIAKKDLVESGQSCILYGELYTRYSDKINNVISKTRVDSKKSIIGKKNDILIPSSGETAIDIARASSLEVDNILIGGDINIFRPKNDVLGSFISYSINSIRKYDLSKLAQGSSVYHLYGSALSEFKILVPPLNEQQRIVDILSLVDDQVEAFEEEYNQLKQIKTAFLSQLF